MPITHYAAAMSQIDPPSDPGVHHAIILTRCTSVSDYDSFNQNAVASTDGDLLTCKECRKNIGGRGPLTIHHLRNGRVSTNP